MSDNLHFIGIGGIGMSALARIALQRGLRVSGSSDKASATTERLHEEGATVFIGHQASHVPKLGRVVVTSAVRSDNPELLAAQATGLPILRRGELLAEWFNTQRGIALAGTHGKTTTTAMLASIFEQAGYDPTVAVGGERRETGTNFRCGASEWFISEADESDGSFLALRPQIALVSNIENDHITSDEGIAGLITQFRTFLGSIPAHGLAVVCADEPAAHALAQEARPARTVQYGFSPEADYQARNACYEGFNSRCEVFARGVKIGDIALQIPGAMNLSNALAATTIASEVGIAFEHIAKALAGFGGVRRRFDILARDERMSIVDDYAHHPTALAATIAAARHAHPGPIIVAFQPHRYTRTEYLAADFARALVGVEQVVLTEIYAASEPPIAGVDERLIGDPLTRAGAHVVYVRRADLNEYLFTHTPPGTLVLLLGAGDITAVAHGLAARIQPAVALV